MRVPPSVTLRGARDVTVDVACVRDEVIVASIGAAAVELSSRVTGARRCDAILNLVADDGHRIKLGSMRACEAVVEALSPAAERDRTWNC